MFNFTTLTVLNKVVLNTSDPKNYNIAVSNSDNPSVRIGNIRFTKQTNTANIYVGNQPTVIDVLKVNWHEAHFTKITLPLNSLVGQAGNYRIAFYLGLSQNSQEAFYSNDLVYKGKPLYIEFAVAANDDVEDIISNVVNIAKKYLLFTAQLTLLNVYDAGKYTSEEVEAYNTAHGSDPGHVDVTTSTSKGEVIFEGVNGYQLIRQAYLQKYDPEAVKIDCCSTDGEFVNLLTGVPCIFDINKSTGAVNVNTAKKFKDGDDVDLGSSEFAIEPGIEAFGDYNWIIHNLRLPTGANTHFWSPTKDEMPVVGGNYVQFIVRLLTNRDGIGLGAVGQRVTSVTTHVFWVLDSGSNVSNFNTLFATNLSVSPDGKAGTKLDDPFGVE